MNRCKKITFEQIFKNIFACFLAENILDVYVAPELEKQIWVVGYHTTIIHRNNDVTAVFGFFLPFISLTILLTIVL